MSTSASAQLPAALPPPGQTLDFGNRTPMLHAYYAGETVTQPFLAGVLFMRLFTQNWISGGLVLEDFVMIIAYLFQLGTVAVGRLCMGSGSGAHMWNLTVADFSDLFKYLFYYSILYNATSVCIKNAILLQYLRVLVPYRGNMPAWIACWTCIIMNSLFYTTVIIMQFFQCAPIGSQWNITRVDHCISLATIYQFSGLFNAVSDFVILVLPIPIIFLLKMSLRRKLGTYILFAFAGLLVCVAWGLRAYYTWHVFDSPDMSYYFWEVGLWSQFEMTSDFFIYCLPILPGFYFFIKNKFLASRSSTDEESAASVKDLQPHDAKKISEASSLSSAGGKDGLTQVASTCLKSNAVEKSTHMSSEWSIGMSAHPSLGSLNSSDLDLPSKPELVLPKGTRAAEFG